MIHIENLCKQYQDLQAVDQISFDIKKGEILGLLGPNGAGKTTTLRMLTCFLRPTSGSVRVKDLTIENDDLAIKKLMGYLPESAPLYKDMLVYDYLVYIANIRGVEPHVRLARIKELARRGFYDGVPFHRVVPNFVAQTGDFARQDGFGGPGFAIRSELTLTPYHRGVLGMASAGKDTEGSQFFITHSVQPHLGGGYTSFGWVVEGMDVIDGLYEEDRILSARVDPGLN